MSNDEYLSVYTRQQAIEDGVFVDISERANAMGIKIPVAVTSNLFHTHIRPSENMNDEDVASRLYDLLHSFMEKARRTEDSFMEFFVGFKNEQGVREHIKIWAVCEAQSPDDPSPAINIMLPEDY